MSSGKTDRESKRSKTRDKVSTEGRVNAEGKGNSEGTDELIVNLRSPGVAAFLAWLIPGAGHFYQRRFGKGFLFMVCILGTYFFGLTLGDGRVVYASFRKNDIRWQYVCQFGVGLPALPALVQSEKLSQGRPNSTSGRWMAPPTNVDPNRADTLSDWHLKLKWRFELATLYTMVAGLLNVLAIYDAYAGPMLSTLEEKPTGTAPDRIVPAAEPVAGDAASDVSSGSSAKSERSPNPSTS